MKKLSVLIVTLFALSACSESDVPDMPDSIPAKDNPTTENPIPYEKDYDEVPEDSISDDDDLTKSFAAPDSLSTSILDNSK